MVTLRIISNIMDSASQIVASTKIQRGDGKGGNANRDKDQVEYKYGHWMILLIDRWPPEQHHELFISMW